MKSLIRHVQEGGQLESHADVPEIVRQQLYVEQQERLQRKRKASNGDSNGHPPVTINNVLPASTGPSTGHEVAGTASAPGTSEPRDFELPGFRDVALHQYSE